MDWQSDAGIALAAALLLTVMPLSTLWLIAGDRINDRLFGDNNVTLAFVLFAPYSALAWAVYFVVS